MDFKTQLLHNYGTDFLGQFCTRQFLPQKQQSVSAMMVFVSVVRHLTERVYRTKPLDVSLSFSYTLFFCTPTNGETLSMPQSTSFYPERLNKQSISRLLFFELESLYVQTIKRIVVANCCDLSKFNFFLNFLAELFSQNMNQPINFFKLLGRHSLKSFTALETFCDAAVKNAIESDLYRFCVAIVSWTIGLTFPAAA